MESLFYLGFSAFPGVGPTKFLKLLDFFQTTETAWNATEKDLAHVLGDKLAAQFSNFRKNFSVEKFAESLEKRDIQFVTAESEKYPLLLKKVHNAPFVLYSKGDVSLLQNSKTIGIVGTRKVTEYGREVTQNLTAELVGHGFVIVSGLALGVDGIAHQTALISHGKTIAVLGSGVDVCTPREHQLLYNQILEKGGAIVSAFLPGQTAIVGSFPARNRIVAGLSQGILVTEGAKDSGSLITANFAKEFERPIFAVPGPITSSLSKGANNLLAEGAIVTTSGKAILDKLGIMNVQKTQTLQSVSKSDDPEEQKVLGMLEFGALHFDDIVRKMDKDSKTIGSLLSLMELKGLLRQQTDGMYSLT